MSTAARIITADDLLRMPGDQRCELVRGELRTMSPTGFEHGRITIRLTKLLVLHVDNHKLGVILGAETGFRLSRNPDTVRAADISFIASARIPAGSKVKGYWEGGPDLAVEVLSPSDSAEEVEEKIDDYLGADTRLVWILNPRRRTIAVHRPGRDPQVLRDTDTLTGEDVIPGFACKVAEAFD